MSSPSRKDHRAAETPQTLKALVVDDEPAGRHLLVELLAQHKEIEDSEIQHSRLEVVDTCRHGQEAVDWLSRQRVDVLFLDIRMPGMDGFEVLDALRDHPSGDRRPAAVVFVTAFDDFAVRAFEAEAWDYLLKPFDEQRLRQTLERVLKRWNRQADPNRRPPTPLTRISVPKGRGRVTLRLSEVIWIGAESNYVRFHLSDQSYLARRSLRSLESELDPGRFVRVHRSTIVNVQHIVRLDPIGHGDLRIRMKNGEDVTLSRRFRTRFEEVVKAW